MTPLSQFLPRVLVYTPACSEPMLIQALLDTAIDFCEKTAAVRYLAGPEPVPANTASVALCSTNRQLEITMVLRAYLNDEELAPTPADLVRYPAPQTTKPTSYTYAKQGCDTQVILNAFADEDYTLTAEVVVKPTRTAESVPEELFEKWVDAIVAGTLARIYMIPGQPFSAPDAGAYQQARYARMVHNARIDASHGRLRGSLTVKLRPFA